MSIDVAPELEGLGIALGVLQPEGDGDGLTWNLDFLANPDQHLTSILTNEDQRDALLGLLADVLGTDADPDLPNVPAGETWLPLVEEGPGGLYVLVEAVDSSTVRLSVAGRVGRAADGVDASASVRVPLLEVASGTITPLVGGADGALAITASIAGQSGPLVSEDGLTVDGVSLRASIETDPDADPPAALSVVVQGLAFSASDPPEDLDLRDLATKFDAEAVRLLLAALRSRAGDAPELAHLFAMLGLGPAGSIPSLPLANLTGSDPETALKGWLRQVIVDAGARNAWLGELAGLVGATVPTAGELCFIDTTTAAVCLTVTGDADPASGAPRIRVGLRGRGRAPGDTAHADLVAEAELLRVSLSTPTQITGLPDLRATVRVTGAAGPLVDTPNHDGHALRIGSLDVGVAIGSDRALVPVLTARDVVLDTTTFETLDLTDADAVMGAAATTASDSLSNLLQQFTDLLDGSPEARALASLLGLRAPTASWTPQLPDPAKLLVDPLRELCCYQARVLAVPGAWSQLLGQLFVLVGAGAAPAVTGAGSAADPWRVPVSTNTTGSVDLLVWSRAGTSGETHLLLGAAAKIGTEIATDARLAVELRTELLDATLPALPDCTGSVGLDVARCHTLAITLGDDLTFDTGDLIVRAQRVDFGLRWCRGGDPEPVARITGGTVVTGTGVVTIPDLDIDADFDVTALSGQVVMALGDLFGAWFSGGGTSWWRLGPLLGLLPGLPGVPGFSLADLPTLAAQLQGQTQWRGFFDASSAGMVSGRGSHADPWALSTGSNDLPELLAWLDPDGPPADVGGIPRGILPPQLTEALDAGADALQPERLAELLGRATAVAPEVAEVVDADLGAALRLLHDRLAETDGLVPGDAQVVAGWQRIDLGATTHLAEPGALDLATDLPGLPAATRRVYVSAPLPWAAAWPDADPTKVIDLREAGRNAATFSFDHVTGDGPWHVLLPSRANAVSAAEPDGLDGLTARLLAAVTAVRSAVGGPVALIAHGTSGHAARRVAATPGLLTDVVTVGTPHSSAPLAWLAQQDVRRAVRVLQRLRARAGAAAAAAGPANGLLETVSAALDGIVTEQQGADTLRRHVPFPFADYTAPTTAPALAPGVTGHCVVGVLAAADIDGALTEVIGRGIQAITVPPAGRGLPKHLGLGARTRLPDGSTAAGAVRVDADVRADLHLVEVSGGAADHRAVPSLRLHADVGRNDGWLVAPPSTGLGERQDPRVRSVSVDLSVEVGEPVPAAVTSAPRISGSITLHDVSVLGRWHERWVIDSTTVGSLVDGASGASGTLPEARMLLGLVAASLGDIPATGALRRLADLLTALDVAELDASNRLEFVTDGLTQLLTDPDALLADLRANTARLNALLDAVAAFGGGSRTSDAILLTASSDVEVAILGSMPNWSLRLRTLSPQTVVKGMALDAAVTVDGAGRVQGSLGLVSPVELGPVGRPRLQVGLDTDATAPVSLAITLPEDQLGKLPATVALLPTPDLSALGDLAAAVLPGELLRHALTWAHAQAPAVVDPLLDVLGLLAPASAPLPVRSGAGLLSDPGGWLAAADALGGTGSARRLEPVRMQALVDAFAGIAGQAAASGTLALPGGLTLRADAATDGRARLRVDVPAPAAGTGGVGGSVGVLLGDDLDLAPAVSLDVRLGPVAGLDDAGVTIGASGDDPTLSISVTKTGGAAITLPLLPASGWGTLTAIADAAAAAAVQHVLPFVLDAAVDVVPAIASVGDALGVRTAGDFDGAKLQALANDPAARLREATAVPSLLGSLDALLDAVGVAGVTVTMATSTIAIQPVSGLRLEVRLGASPQLCVNVDPVAPITGLSIGGAACVGPSGVTGAELSIEITDSTLLGTDPVVLLPFVLLEFGDRASGPDRLLIGLWNDTPAAAGRKALAAGLPLTGLSPTLTCLQADRTPEADTAGCVAEVALSVLLPLLGDLVLAADAVQGLLDESLLGEAQLLGNALDAAGVVDVVSGEYVLEAGVFSDLTALPGTLLALAGELVSAVAGKALGDSLGPLSIHPVVDGDDSRTWYGLRLAFAEGLSLADGSDIGLALDGYRGDFADSTDRGIAIYLISHPDGADIASTARCTPRIEIDELGLRMTGAGQGALLSDPIGVAAVGLFGSYDGRVSLNGAGDITGWQTDSGGMRLAVRKLSIPLGTGESGGNPVAQKMLSQAEEPNAAGDDEQLAAGFDLEIEVTTSGFEVHVGLGDPPWWIPVQRSFGPLYVDQFGLVVEDLDSSIDTIGVLFDGGLELAGLAVGVDDLGILYDLDEKELKLELAGLAIAYDGGGLTLSGGLRRAGADYLGMLQLQFSEYGLTAVGGWGEHPAGAPEADRYTALFVFGVLTAPLGGPPPFFVTAIGAGFGINRRLVLPARIEDVPTFPLVDAMRSDSTLAQNPMGALNKLAETFPPHRGTFWFAAGVRFTSFVLVESVAVLGVEVGDGLEVSVLGLSRAVLPDPSFPMASVELALRARFSTREGVLAIQAQLTDNSWLISESCRLTGGFAFVVWFRTGQFVLTLGGYHPRFPKPADFPDVPRLGFHWSVSDAITIKGGLYFALTSSAVMVGGSLEASYRTSWAWAAFEMGAHALIMWDPFHYDFEVYIRVSAGVRIRICVPLLGCATIGFSFSIGARVHIVGPEFRGTAELDLDVVTITVSFGATGDEKPDDELAWDDFRRRYLTDGDAMTGLEMSLGEGRYVESGAPASDADEAVDGPWELLPEFVVLMTTTVASNSFGGTKLDDLEAIDLGPMRIAGATNDLTVTLYDVSEDRDVDRPGVTIESRIGPLPEAVWKQYDKAGDAPPAANLITAVTGARLIVRSKVLDRTGDIALDQVDVGELVHPLPLRQQLRWREALDRHRARAAELVAWANRHAAGSAVAHLLAEGRLTAVSDTSGRWRLAMTADAGAAAVINDVALSEDRSDALLANELPTATRPARPVPLAGRAAPPRVRSLASGMRRDVGAPVEVARAVIPTPPARPAPQLAPRLEAVLHEVAVPRDTVPATSASRVGARLPRLAPPSLASVREAGRSSIGAHLRTVAPPITEEVGARAGSRAATGIAGDRHEWSATDARLAPSRLRALRRLERDVLTDGVEVPTGRVHVWRVPDSSRDNRQERPTVSVAGDGEVRVVALDRAGRVLADSTTTEGRTTLPRGTSRVAVAGIAGGPTGLAGWHAGTRLVRVSALSLLAPGAVVRSEAASSRRGGRKATTGLVSPADVVPERGTVSTTLPSSTRTIVVGLEPLGEAATPDGFSLSLGGASRGEGDPVIVRAGERIYGVFRVAVDEDAQQVTAHVATDKLWHLAAVVGSPDDLPVVVAWLGRGGLEETLPGLAGAAGGSAQVRWSEPRRTEDT